MEVMLNVEDFGEKERIVNINSPLLAGYLQAIEQIKAQLKQSEEVTLEQILQLPDVLQISEPELDWESLKNLCLQAANEALNNLVAMRQAEGQSLKEDLLQKIGNIENLLKQVAQIAPEVVDDYRNRLEERLELLLDGTTITEERFLGEVAIFAEKCSIDEELVRLTSHIQQFKDSLQSAQIVGRKLDFLLIEMNREANTIGSKANKMEIANLVVEIKSELEKIREQVQNIE